MKLVLAFYVRWWYRSERIAVGELPRICITCTINRLRQGGLTLQKLNNQQYINMIDG